MKGDEKQGPLGKGDDWESTAPRKSSEEGSSQLAKPHKRQGLKDDLGFCHRRPFSDLDKRGIHGAVGVNT